MGDMYIEERKGEETSCHSDCRTPPIQGTEKNRQTTQESLRGLKHYFDLVLWDNNLLKDIIYQRRNPASSALRW